MNRAKIIWNLNSNWKYFLLDNKICVVNNVYLEMAIKKPISFYGNNDI